MFNEVKHDLKSKSEMLKARGTNVSALKQCDVEVK